MESPAGTEPRSQAPLPPARRVRRQPSCATACSPSLLRRDDDEPRPGQVSVVSNVTVSPVGSSGWSSFRFVRLGPQGGYLDVWWTGVVTAHRGPGPDRTCVYDHPDTASFRDLLARARVAILRLTAVFAAAVALTLLALAPAASAHTTAHPTAYAASHTS